MSSLPARVPPSDPTPVWTWVRVRALVLDSLGSPHSRRVYAKALEDFWAWGQQAAAGGFTRETVQQYRAHLAARGLAPASLNLHLTVLRKLAQEAAEHGVLPHDVAASITSVKGIRQKGVRLGTWLTLDQAQALLTAPTGDSLRAQRDRAVLALLVGCGLRRSEIAALELTHLQQRDGRWVLVDVAGKGNRLRSVPMPSWAKAAVDRWTAVAGLTGGRLFHSVSQTGGVGESLTAQAVYGIVTSYAEPLELTIAPHDLRRTFAKLAHRGRAPLEQIQLSLGHDSILTTERYLGVRQNLTDAPCDHLGLEMENG